MLTNKVVENDQVNLISVSGVTISPDGKNIYAVGANSKSIVHWDRDTSTGALTNKVALIDPGNLNNGISVTVSPDGKNVYGAFKSSHSIVYWNRERPGITTCGTDGSFDTLTCGANVCTCPNGTPVVAVGTGGTFCGANADVDCSACNPGYSLSVTPAADTLSTCPANICTCQNGSPSVAAGAGATLCETDADVDCSACNVGYSPSVTPAAGTKSTCVANPCAATEVANSVDHSSTGAIILAALVTP